MAQQSPEKRHEWYVRNREKHLAYCREQYLKNHEARKAHARETYCSEKNRVYKRLVTYGLTSEQYESLVVKQNGCCAICGTKPKKLHVDHCHNSGRIRGLLCFHCNFVLGQAKDSKLTLQKAIEYLTETAL